ncbi:MAG: hypothetical protein M1836_000883 [Candelina mexicana]|nr:MAG: hypothetical protein M1836_000883 [Candelina mexicana]
MRLKCFEFHLQYELQLPMKLENGPKAQKSSRDGLPIKPHEKSATRYQFASKDSNSVPRLIEPALQWQPASVDHGTASEAVKPRRTLFSRFFSLKSAGPSSGAALSAPPQVPGAASKPKFSPTSINASAGSQLSTGRFGTKSSVRDGELPGNYKATARKYRT